MKRKKIVCLLILSMVFALTTAATPNPPPPKWGDAWSCELECNSRHAWCRSDCWYDEGGGGPGYYLCLAQCDAGRVICDLSCDLIPDY